MKDSEKKGVVLATPAMIGFFGAAFLNVSIPSPRIQFIDLFVLRVLVSIEKPSLKKGLIGASAGLGLGVCMCLLIQYCTADANKNNAQLKSKLQEAEATIASLKGELLMSKEKDAPLESAANQVSALAVEETLAKESDWENIYSGIHL